MNILIHRQAYRKLRSRVPFSLVLLQVVFLIWGGSFDGALSAPYLMAQTYEESIDVNNPEIQQNVENTQNLQEQVVVLPPVSLPSLVQANERFNEFDESSSSDSDEPNSALNSQSSNSIRWPVQDFELEENIEPQSEVESPITDAQAQRYKQPSLGGLGIGNFSAQDIRKQLNTVRQFSATPLQLPKSTDEQSFNKTAENLPQATQSNNNLSQITPFIPVPSAPIIASKTNQSPEITSNSTEVTQFVPRGFEPQSPPPAISQNQPAPQDFSNSPESSENPRTFVRNQESNTKQAEANTVNRKIQKSNSAETPKDLVSHTARPRASSLKTRNTPKRGIPSAPQQTSISKTIPLGDPFQLSLHGLIWTYIPGLSQYPREPEFERELGNLETSFRFRFPTVGRYYLTFSRQFPSTGDLEYYNAEITVENVPFSGASQSSSDILAASNRTGAPSRINPPENNIKLTEATNRGISVANRDISYRITSQVISDILRMLENGELNAAYKTLNNWPSRERGDIYDTAAQYFIDAGMNKEAVDMWQRNVDLEGKLSAKAVAGIIQALTNLENPTEMLAWLPQFLEQVKKQKANGLEGINPVIGAEEFTKVYQVISKLDQAKLKQNSDMSEDMEHILDFYQTYVGLYPDKTNPEILYHIGLFLEQPGKNQDFRQARQLYNNLQVKYPVDEYSQKASKRLNYLNQHIFLVR